MTQVDSLVQLKYLGNNHFLRNSQPQKNQLEEAVVTVRASPPAPRGS